MNDNLEYTEYNDEKNRIPWKRIFLTLLIFVAAFIIVILVLKACARPSLREDLIKAGKEYYEKYPNELPTEVAECYTINLEDLEKENLVKASNYSTCDERSTYVNVCYLESKTYHYSAVLDCENEKTNYGMWKDGNESDLTNKSDVRFRYLGEEKQTGVKYYYPNNLTDSSKTNEYYASIPNANYGGKEDEQTGYKWYTEKTVNSYWNNGSYSSTQPSGYPNKGESKTVTTFSETKPATATYRTIHDQEATTYYKERYMSYIGGVVCYNAKGEASPTLVKCNDDYPTYSHSIYTCDGTNPVPINTVCKDWSGWTKNVCTPSALNGRKCESKQGFTYTDTMWKWYTNKTVRSYYPSGSSDANGESTYYVNQPVSGAIKDENSKSTVYKFYKLEKETTNTNYEEWLEVTNGYVALDELLSTFKTLNYEVNNLKDINKIEDIRYQYKLQYRNLEE